MIFFKCRITCVRQGMFVFLKFFMMEGVRNIWMKFLVLNCTLLSGCVSSLAVFKLLYFSAPLVLSRLDSIYERWHLSIYKESEIFFCYFLVFIVCRILWCIIIGLQVLPVLWITQIMMIWNMLWVSYLHLWTIYLF